MESVTSFEVLSNIIRKHCKCGLCRTKVHPLIFKMHQNVWPLISASDSTGGAYSAPQIHS